MPKQHLKGWFKVTLIFLYTSHVYDQNEATTAFTNEGLMQMNQKFFIVKKIMRHVGLFDHFSYHGSCSDLQKR